MKNKFKKMITFSSLIGLPIIASFAASCNSGVDTDKGKQDIASTQAEKFAKFLQTKLNNKASVTENDFKKLVLTSEADPKKVIYELIGKDDLDQEIIDFIDSADKIEVSKDKDKMTIIFTVTKEGELPLTVTVDFSKCTFMPEQIQDMLNKLANTASTTKTEAEIKALEFKDTEFLTAVPQLSGLTLDELELPKDASAIPDGPEVLVNKDKGSLEFTFTFDFSAVEGYDKDSVFHKTLEVNEFSVPKKELIARPLIKVLEDEGTTWYPITYGDQKIKDTGEFDIPWREVLENLKSGDHKIYIKAVRKASPLKPEYYILTPADKDREGKDRPNKDGHIVIPDALIIRVENIINHQDISEILIDTIWGKNADQKTTAISKKSIKIDYDSDALNYYNPDFEEVILSITFLGDIHSENDQIEP